MKLRVSWIQARPGKDKASAVQSLTRDYVERISRYVAIETSEHPNEERWQKALSETKARPFTVLLDTRGKQMTSEELAKLLDAHRSRGTSMLFALGGADGWSDAARGSADLRLSLGKMTLPHELARVVLLEQIYRAFTILQGHPYHTGH